MVCTVWNQLGGQRYDSSHSFFYHYLALHKLALHKFPLLGNYVNILFHICLYVSGKQVRFIVMGNLFCSEYHIHRRFDLKGSSYGRTTDKAEKEIDDMTTLKDLDLNYVFRLHNSWYLELLE